MLPYFWYILKVILCSGILFGYYWLFLRNKIFHQYNRFYLLAALAVSLLLPLLKIDFWQQDSRESQVIKVLQVVSAGDDYMNNVIITANKDNWNMQQLFPVIYWIVSMIFFLVLLQTLFVIHSLLKKYPVQLIDKFTFVNTDDKSTPFSFFQYIFWNTNIDMDTATGKQIFKHEVAHIQEKHTYDKLFVNIILIFFWCNPFFWFYRRELNMIHEFIADKKAVEDSDTASFAAMILHAAYPQHRFQLTNNFFYSPIKRRLLMLTKNNNPRVNYITRIMVLPLAILVFAAFSLKAKTNTVAEITKLNIASAITDKSSTITLINSLVKSADNVKKSIDTIPNKSITITVPKGKQPIYILNGSQVDTNILNRLDPNEIESINILKDESALEKYGEKGNNGVVEITLKKNELASTAVDGNLPATLELKYKSDSIHFLQLKENYKLLEQQSKLKTDIAEKTLTEKKLNDQQLQSLKQNLSLLDQQSKANLDIAEKTLTEKKLNDQQLQSLKQNLSLLDQQSKLKLDITEKTLVEKKLQDQQLQSLKQNLVLLENQNKVKLDETEKLLLELKLTDAYKEKEILYEKALQDQQNNITFSKVEVNPQFTGGDAAWRKYLEKNLNPNIPADEGWKAGKYTLIVKFIVHTDGSVSNVETENYNSSKTAQHCIDIIKNAPKWQPAIQNGKKVNAYKKQPITFVIE